jgi:hypothetical protein
MGCGMTEDQKEAREERTAICECEKIPEIEIERIFKSRSDIYGISDRTEVQGNLI